MGHRIEVEDVSLEDNFNFLHLDPTSHNHLLKVKEAYAVFGSAEQAACVLGLKHPISLRVASPVDGRIYQTSIFVEPPAHKQSTRTAYATIDTRLQLLRNVDTRLRAMGLIMGAVSSTEGIPMLPSCFMQTEQFDLHTNECIATDNRDGFIACSSPESGWTGTSVRPCWTSWWTSASTFCCGSAVTIQMCFPLRL